MLMQAGEWIAVRLLKRRPWTDVATAISAMIVAFVSIVAAIYGWQIFLERQLRARIVYAEPYAERGGSAIFAILDVRNASIPTSIEPHSWHMYVAVRGQNREGGASSPSGYLILRLGPHGSCKQIGYPESQTVYARGANVIETGEVMTGFMLGSFPGLDVADIDVTTIRVTFEDAFGKTHETDKIRETASVSTFLKTPGLGEDLGRCK